MKTLRTIAQLETWRAELKAQQQTLGFVPTMGNLHAGHMALIDAAKKHSGAVLVSVFVNPTQFNDQGDFEHYPRTEAKDLELLRQNGADAVFIPDADQIYPGGAPQVTVKAGAAAQPLCGADRPGHFDGVLTVVAKLFNLSGADHAFFGLKDYQQFTVIAQMVRDLNFDIKLQGVDTQRAQSGLALSSRNNRLSADELKLAPEIYQTLDRLVQALTRGSSDYRALEREGRERLTGLGFNVDYVRILDEQLSDPAADSARLGVFIAAKLGAVRLIDNLQLVRSNPAQHL